MGKGKEVGYSGLQPISFETLHDGEALELMNQVMEEAALRLIKSKRIKSEVKAKMVFTADKDHSGYFDVVFAVDEKSNPVQTRTLKVKIGGSKLHQNNDQLLFEFEEDEGQNVSSMSVVK